MSYRRRRQNYKITGPLPEAFKLLVPVGKMVNGVLVKEYKDTDTVIMASVRTFGGTETFVNDILVIEDTGEFETWYNPDLKANSRLVNVETGDVWDVLGTPENIRGRKQYMTFKAKRLSGGA